MTDKVHDYHDGNFYFQDKFDTRRLAERVAQNVTESLRLDQMEFIEHADMFFMATTDHRGLPTCSYKGGDPGFVTVVDDKCIAFPNYDGNGKYQSMGNLVKNPNIGILFIDFVNQSRLRLQGVVSIQEDDELMSIYVGAQFIVRVALTEVYPNCARYVHKYELVERSVYVPRAGKKTPIPESKLQNMDVLPANDPARNA